MTLGLATGAEDVGKGVICRGGGEGGEVGPGEEGGVVDGTGVRGGRETELSMQ